MSDACIDLIKARIEGIKKADAERLAEAIERRAEATAPKNSPAYARALRDAADSVSKDFVWLKKIETRNKLKDTQARVHAYKWIEKNFGDDPIKGAESFLVGVQSGRASARDSVAAHLDAEGGHAIHAFTTDLERNGITQIARDRGNELEMAEAIHALAFDESTAGMRPEIVKLAQIMRDHAEISRLNYNENGGAMRKLRGYMGPQSHDPYKISKVKSAEWMAYIKARLDFERTFVGEGPAKINEILERLYDEFKDGVHFKLQEDPGQSGISSFAKSLNESRVLHFKTPEAAVEYHKKFGHGSIIDGFTSHIMRTAQKAAVMNRLGPNARRNWDNVLDMLHNKYAKWDYADRFKKTREALEEKYWPFIDGSGNVPGYQMWANIGAIARGVETMAKLGGAVFSAFGDLSFSAGESARQGGSFMGGIFDSFSGVFKSAMKGERRELLNEIQVVLDGFISAPGTRFNFSEPGQMSKLVQVYMRVNLLNQWTDRQRAAFAIGMSRRLGMNAEFAHADMNSEMRQILKLYDINEHEWNFIREAGLRDYEGDAYIVTERVEKAPDEMVARYLQTVGDKVTDRNIKVARDRLTRSLRVAFNDRMSHAVIEADIKTKGLLLMGTKPGTIKGEGLRSIMLFKTFSAAVLQKAMGAEFFGRGSETTWRGAGKNVWRSGAFGGMVRMIAASAVLGYASMTVKDAMKGKKPRDITEDPFKVIMAAITQGGGLGIYGDFLFGDMKNRFGGGAVGSLLGPVAGRVNDITDLAQRVRDRDDSAASAVRLVASAIPSVFWTKIIMDRLVWWQLFETLNPGYTSRMEARAKKEMDQEYFSFGPMTSPTQTVR